MKQYKGSIFNSVNIGLLNGELGRVVSANNIRTAVVSRKTRTECKKFMKARGISVDVVIGGHDLDTRYKQFGKPNESERLRMGCRYLEETLDIAKRSAEVSHNSQEGIEGAQAIAAAILLARTGHNKQEIKQYIEENFGYDLDKSVAEHRATRSKNYVCSQSGPEAIRCWLEAESYEQTIRNTVTLHTDADTVADIAGAIADATPGMEVPQEWADRVFDMLDNELKNIFV